MPNKMQYTPAIGDWFRSHREKYEWPIGKGRKASEDDITDLLNKVQVAITNQNPNALKEAMVKIHCWKTQNRQNQTRKYENALALQPANYFQDLLKMAPFTGTTNVQRIIEHLKIQNCNLPVCTAIASFLYGRSSVAVVDKFLSMFFSFRCQVPTVVIKYVKPIYFVLEQSGRGLRLAVYNQGNYEKNRDIYVKDFLNECSDIANDLNRNGVTFYDGDGQKHLFLPVDVEMAIFAWCSKNAKLFS